MIIFALKMSNVDRIKWVMKIRDHCCKAGEKCDLNFVVLVMEWKWIHLRDIKHVKLYLRYLLMWELRRILGFLAKAGR